MSRIMMALFTKLKWQLHAVGQNLIDIEQALLSVEEHINENQRKISNSSAIPAFILPEQEIARVHFLTLQNHNQAQLNIQKMALRTDQISLQKQQIKLNTELKMLEKHQDGKLKIQQKQALQTQQNTSDEWVLQRRGSL